MYKVDDQTRDVLVGFTVLARKLADCFVIGIQANLCLSRIRETKNC